MKLGLKKDEITNGKYGQPTLQRESITLARGWEEEWVSHYNNSSHPFLSLSISPCPHKTHTLV